MNKRNRMIQGMQLLAVAVAATVAPPGCNRTVQEDPWENLEKIVTGIRLPEIPGREFLLTDFGGVGDGVTNQKPVFDSVIAMVEEAGGGKVVVPPGTWLVNGPVNFCSHMELHLMKGAVLLSGNNPDDYLPVVQTTWEGTRCYNYSPLVFAYKCTDVALTGRGTLEGNGSEPWNGWKDLQKEDQASIWNMNNEGAPLEERVFGKGHFLRPHHVQFYECERVLVEDVRISDSPFWCLHFVYSGDITVRGLSYEAFNYNNDGVDVESSHNVLIEEITFNNRDDNIAIKAGRDLEARTLGIPSRNIVVRDCKFRGHNAMAVGSEMSGGVNNVYVQNCGFAGKVEYGFYLKGNRNRGGEVRDIYGRNIEFDSTRSTIIIDSDYKHQGSCCPPKFRNIHVEGIRSSYAMEHGIYLQGFSELPLDSIYIKDVEITSATIPIEVIHTDHLVMDHVVVNGEELEAPSEKESLTMNASGE